MAANATHAQFHQRSASTPQQLHPQHAQAPSTPAHAQTIGRPRRQFGPPPGSVSQAELLATSPGKGGPGGASPATTPNSATPPPRSPNARPAMTTSNGLGSPGTASMHGNQGQPVICPICNITVRNLALLNQHLDSIHPEETDDVKSAVTAFFKNAQKVLNPITKNAATTLKNIPANSSELLRKIQDLDLDVATNSPGNSLVGPAAPGSFLGWTDPRAETMVTKRHWVRESDQDICFHRNCEKSLGLRSGRQNCRCCGNLFCDTHSSYQLRLNAQAKHDANGLWCRVCESCYLKARQEQDKLVTDGVVVSLTTDFKSIRSRFTEKKHLEVNRLEKRIEKLAQIHSQYGTGTASPITPNSPISPSSVSSSGSIRAKGGLLRSVTSKGQQLKVAEQTIVKWVDDASVPACYTCFSVFNRYGNRKHHCRLCGRVICDNCSTKTPLYLNMSTYPDGSEPVGKTRVCKGCIRMVFMKREHAADKKRPNAVLKYYGSLVRLKERIDVALPRFQEMIATIGQKDDMHQAHPDYQATAKIRKELLDDFALFDAISKKINKLPAHSQHQKQLYSNVYWWATQYLQTNMFPLSMIPKVFGGGNVARAGSSPSLSSSPAPSASSPKPGSMAEPEIPDERFAELVVLEEQRRLVESYIDDANRKRKFDDVKSLKMSLDELDQEIAAIRGRK